MSEGSSPDIQPYYFVGHVFDRSQIDDLRAAIDRALEDSGLVPFYADMILQLGQIFLDKILPAIRGSAFAIFDISNPNPNVYLEVGAAIGGLQPSYILICRAGSSIPSNLQGLDRVEYASFAELTERLKRLARPFWQDLA